MTFCATVWNHMIVPLKLRVNLEITMPTKNTTILESFSPEIINTIIDFQGTHTHGFKSLLSTLPQVRVLFGLIQNAQGGGQQGAGKTQKKKPKAQTGIFANKAPRSLFWYGLDTFPLLRPLTVLKDHKQNFYYLSSGRRPDQTLFHQLQLYNFIQRN